MDELTDTMPPALPDGYVCPANTVAGWLNGDGLPTSCVGDNPMPERTAEPGAPLEPPVAYDPATFYEVAFYVYPKLDPTLPAAWPNSGVQDLIATAPGVDWFTEFPGELPAYVCGPGWGVQQDKVSHDGSFVWPESIEYPHDNIGWPPIYAAQHTDLETYIDVPECVQATPTPVPSPPVLAETGAEWLLIAAVGLGLLATGFAFLVARRLAKPAVVPDAVTGLVPMDAPPKYKRK